MRSARDEILSLLPPAAIGAEVGVWTGDFSARILEATAPKRLHLIDPFQSRSEPAYDNAWYGTSRGADMDSIRDAVSTRFAKEIEQGQVELHVTQSQIALAALPQHSLDFVYIDGDHTYDAVKADLDLSFVACKPGGLICLDDYVIGGWWGNSVLRATHEFLGSHADKCGIVYCHGGQVAIQVFPSGT